MSFLLLKLLNKLSTKTRKRELCEKQNAILGLRGVRVSVMPLCKECSQFSYYYCCLKKVVIFPNKDKK
jgi:hypothetical protein